MSEDLHDIHPADLPGTVPDSSAATPLADKALRVSELRYRRLFEAAQDGILILNAETGQIEDVNPYLMGLLDYSHAEFLGKKMWEISAFKDTALNQEVFAELKKMHYIRYDDLPLQTRDGRQISVEFISNVYECDNVEIVQCNIRDNTERHRSDLDFRAATRQHQLLSAINNALVKAKTEEDLLKEYCRIIVQTGGYRMAWVGFAENGPDKRVVPMTHFGLDDGYLESVIFTWANTEDGLGPTGSAIRTGQIQNIKNIPADTSPAPWRIEALKRGFQSAFALPFHYSDEKVACLTAYGERGGIWPDSEPKLMREIASDLGFGITGLRTAISRTQYQESLRVGLEQTIQVIADTIDQRDAYTSGHQKRVAELCTRIGNELGLSEERTHGLHLAASIHDLGKIGIPAEILSKPGHLSAMQYNLIKEHSQLGYDILRHVTFPWPIADIVLQHHERLDGSGYPNGLKADAMLLESRILAVADVVEAMSSHRPYRAAKGIDVALDEILAQRGILYDAKVVDACVRLFRENEFAFPA